MNSARSSAWLIRVPWEMHAHISRLTFVHRLPFAWSVVFCRLIINERCVWLGQPLNDCQYERISHWLSGPHNQPLVLVYDDSGELDTKWGQTSHVLLLKIYLKNLKNYADSDFIDKAFHHPTLLAYFTLTSLFVVSTRKQPGHTLGNYVPFQSAIAIRRHSF